MASLQHLIHLHIRLNLCLSVLEIINPNKSELEKWIVLLYIKIFNSVGRNENSRQGLKIINSPNRFRYFWYTATLCTYSQIVHFVFDRIENVVEKGENAGYQYLIFPSYFQNASFPGRSKAALCSKWLKWSFKHGKEPLEMAWYSHKHGTVTSMVQSQAWKYGHVLSWIKVYNNPLPDIPILGSSNSAANKDVMS